MNLLVESIAHHNLPYSHNILVRPRRHQRHDLPQARYWKPVLLFFELQLLQRIDSSGVITLCAEDDAISAFLDVVEAGVAVDGPTGE